MIRNEALVSGEGKTRRVSSSVCVVFELENQICAPLYDHIFNVVALVDLDSKEQIGAFRYSSFGIKESLYEKSVQSPWLYSNQQYDELVDLYHFGVRDYHEMEAVYGNEFKLATIAHSRVSLDFYEGTKDLSDNVRGEMSILALGSAKLLDQRMYGRLSHYSNIYDLVNHFALMTCTDVGNSGSPKQIMLCFIKSH